MSKLKIPHTYVILVIILIFVTLLTYVLPSGAYDRVEDPATGRMIAVQGTYHFTEAEPITPFNMIMAIPRGMIEAADIIFFIFFAYGLVYMLIKSGAFYGAVGTLLKSYSGKEKFIIPLFVFVFSLAGTTVGIYEEFYGLIPVFVGIGIAMGYDGLVGGAIVILGMATGFAAGTTNPFTVGVAQGIAGLPLMSGLYYRIIVYLVFITVAIIYLMRYAAKVKADPSKSIVKDIDFGNLKGMSQEELYSLPFNTKHKIQIGLFVLTIAIMVFGTLQLGWYLDELATLFIIMMVVVGLVAGFNLSDICQYFIEAVREIIFGALVVGVARSLTVVMQDASIVDTIVFYMSGALANMSLYASAFGMLIFQNILNFFIPSGSGQAAVSMPLMTPVADSIGLNRQIAVLAFQFGDGFSNMFWPTACALECGLMGIPLNKWYKFIAPLFGIMLIFQFIFIAIAVFINYGPF